MEMCDYCKKEVKYDMSILIPEQQLRQKIGCYRCTILNASCHLTCDDYEKEVSPKIKQIHLNTK